MIDIVAFDDGYAADFKRLNLEWLHGFGLFEDADLKHLDHARDGIIDKGGHIWMAVDASRRRADGRPEAVGSVALLPIGPGVVELIKLAVTRSAQGHGLGRRLTETAIAQARRDGATRIELVTSHKLEAAIAMYLSFGFVPGPLPPDNPYATADRFMALEL